MGNRTLQISNQHEYEVYTHKVKHDGTLATRKEFERRQKAAEFVQRQKESFGILKDKVESSLVTKNFFARARNWETNESIRKFEIGQSAQRKATEQDENLLDGQNNIASGRIGFQTPAKAIMAEELSEVNINVFEGIEKSKELALLKSNKLAVQGRETTNKKTLKAIEESEESFSLGSELEAMNADEYNLDEKAQAEGRSGEENQSETESQKSLEFLVRTKKNVNEYFIAREGADQPLEGFADKDHPLDSTAREQMMVTEIDNWIARRDLLMKNEAADQFIVSAQTHEARQAFLNNQNSVDYREIDLAAFMQNRPIHSRTRDEDLSTHRRKWNASQDEC